MNEPNPDQPGTPDEVDGELHGIIADRELTDDLSEILELEKGLAQIKGLPEEKQEGDNDANSN
jgi:hypothetical protein